MVVNSFSFSFYNKSRLDVLNIFHSATTCGNGTVKQNLEHLINILFNFNFESVNTRVKDALW